MEENSSTTETAAPADTTETTQETESTGTSTAQSAQASAEKKIKQEIRKFKLKINGQEKQLDEKTVIAMAQKGMAADQKFQKTAQRQKQLDSLMKRAKQDPDTFFRQVFGEDAVQFSKKRLSKQLQELSLDPKQKKLREYERKIQEYEKKQAEQQEAKKKQAEQKAVSHWTNHYDKVLPQAIKAAGLPLTQDVIRHVTDIMIASLEDGFDMPMESVMELAKDRYLGSVKKFLSAADKEKLVELLGEDVVSKLGVQTKKKQPAKVTQQATTKQQKRVISQAQAEKQLEQRIKRWSSQ